MANSNIARFKVMSTANWVCGAEAPGWFLPTMLGMKKPNSDISCPRLTESLFFCAPRFKYSCFLCVSRRVAARRRSIALRRLSRPIEKNYQHFFHNSTTIPQPWRQGLKCPFRRFFGILSTKLRKIRGVRYFFKFQTAKRADFIHTGTIKVLRF